MMFKHVETVLWLSFHHFPHFSTIGTWWYMCAHEVVKWCEMQCVWCRHTSPDKFATCSHLNCLTTFDNRAFDIIWCCQLMHITLCNLFPSIDFHGLAISTTLINKILSCWRLWLGCWRLWSMGYLEYAYVSGDCEDPTCCVFSPNGKPLDLSEFSPSEWKLLSRKNSERLRAVGN